MFLLIILGWLFENHQSTTKKHGIDQQKWIVTTKNCGYTVVIIDKWSLLEGWMNKLMGCTSWVIEDCERIHNSQGTYQPAISWWDGMEVFCMAQLNCWSIDMMIWYDLTVIFILRKLNHQTYGDRFHEWCLLDDYLVDWGVWLYLNTNILTGWWFGTCFSFP
jgi:hypothetical protein